MRDIGLKDIYRSICKQLVFPIFLQTLEGATSLLDIS
jgi:hypothetical protein